MMSIPSWRVAAVVVLLLAGCASGPGQYTEEAEAGPEIIYKQAQKQIKQRDYQGAIEAYNRLQSRYPFGDYAQRAHLETIMLHYRKKQWEQALAVSDRYIQEYPRADDLPYVYYMRGLVNYERSIGFLEGGFLDIRKTGMDTQYLRRSFESFSLLLQRFPASEYAADARQRMIFIRNRLARHELGIAEFYLDNRAFVAAIERADTILRRYQGARATGRALAVMVHGYRALGLEQRAEEARRVLAASFPDDKKKLLAKSRPPARRSGLFGLGLL